MEKILVSTKQAHHAGSSDAPGTSLTQLLHADYLQQNMNYKVYLSDPFYDSHNILNKFCYVLTDQIINNFQDFDRILDPLFCMGQLYNYKNNKLINFEGREFINKEYSYKKSEYQIYQNKSFKTINVINKANYFKCLDIPYDMYYDLFAREKFVPSFFLKKKKELPINKNKNVFSIQIRRFTHKKNLTLVAPKNYDEFIINLVNKIKKEANNPNIIFYGVDRWHSNEDILIKKLLDLNCIHLESYSTNTLERALILANYTNYIFSQHNGFTTFAIYIGQSKNILKEKYYINSESDFSEHFSRRILLNGYLGNSYPINTNFFNGKFYPVNTILDANLNKLKKDRVIKKKIANKDKLKKKKLPLLVYDISDLPRHYFSKDIDNIIFKNFIKDLRILHKTHRIIKIKNKDILKKNIQKNLNLSTHYSLKKKYKNHERFGLGSFDFLTHPHLEKLIKKKLINGSNIFYDNLYSYFVRKIFKSKTTNKIKDLSKKILVIDDPNVINTKKNILHKIKRRLNIFTKEDDQEDWYKFREYLNKNFSNSAEFLYIKKNKLVYQNYKKNYFQINEKNIKKIFKKYNRIICRPNHLSLLIKFLFPQKNIIFYSRNQSDKKIFLKNHLLFFHDNEMHYCDFFKEKFISTKEVFLYFFKQFKL